MKTTFFAVIILLVGCISCKKSGTEFINDHPSMLDTVTFGQSMKGWELYSLSNGNDWTYSILKGTNRGKYYDKVVTNKVKVMGKDSLKMLLAKLPANEQIFWAGKGWLANTSGVHFDLTIPDTNTVDEIRDFCTQKGLVLFVNK